MPESRGVVLVIDDNQAGRYTLARTLQQAGFSVIEGSSGQDALHLVARDPDVLVLDLQLPDVSGFEVCRRIKADPMTARVPILHISAEFIAPEDGGRALDSGADAYLRQPADPEVLVALVHALVRARRVREDWERLAQNENLRLRRQLTEALSLSEQRFRIGLKGSPICVWEQDIGLRYTWVYNLLPGWETVDPVGRTDDDLIAPQDLPRLAAFKKRVLATGSRVREELSLATRSETRVYDFAIEPLRNPSGEITGLAGTAVDITETKRLQSKLADARKMESIGLLVGGIAHQFNNFLTGILGNASLLLDSIEPAHSGRPQLDAVIEASERAAELVSRLLAFAGKESYVLEPLDLCRFVSDNLDMVRALIPAALRLETGLASDLPAIRGDASHLRRLLTSLVINAVEAIGEREGAIRVNTGLQRVAAPGATSVVGEPIEPGEYVFLEVSDSGCGMDEATMLRVFDPFFTTKFTGRGLGLSAVKGIVKGHHGAIEVCSAPGGGTTFRALFPTDLSKIHPPAPTILVADADHFIRQMTRAVLERQGYSVLLAADAPEALSKFENYAAAISAVVLDESIPETGAAELLERFRSICPNVGVIVASGRPGHDVLPQFPSERAPLFIRKPYTARQIADLVKTATQMGFAAGAS